MRRLRVILVFLLATLAATPAGARGGQAADDCPPNSKDPDCAAK